MESGDLIRRIVRMEAFEEVFTALKMADPVNGGAIEKAIRASVQECHDGLVQADVEPERVRYLLLREVVEIKAQASPFLNYEREMASREAALWRFALGSTESLFELLGDALDGYFQAKARVIVEDVENAAAWYTGLTDTAKKGGVLVNIGAKAVKRGASLLSERLFGEHAQGVGARVKRGLDYAQAIPDTDLIDTRDVVRQAIERHMSQETLLNDVQKILAEAGRRYQESWATEIRAQTPDTSSLHVFAAGAGGELPGWKTFEMGAAEQTLAVGLGGAAVAALSLAAGWHVLAYAMVHVFYPVAIAAALASLGVAYFTQEKSKETRKRKVLDAIEQCHRHFLVQIDLGKPETLGGRTIRQAMADQAKGLVADTLESWRRVISGNLTVEHYRQLNVACTNHLQLIQQCMASLPGPS